MMDILDVGKIRGIELVATLVRDKDQNQGNSIGDGKEETVWKISTRQNWPNLVNLNDFWSTKGK